MRIILILVVAWAARRLPGTAGAPTVVRFWAMGREGEVVAELVPDFERAHPGIRVEVQQMPWTAAHEKLLTAFAGDALPDVAQLGNTWIPEFVALHALDPVAAVAWSTPAITSPASGTQRHRRQPTACRGTSTRACCSTAATCWPRRATPRPPTTWAEWIDMLARDQAARRTAIAMALLLAAQRVRAAAGAWRCSKTRRCCAMGTRAATFAARTSSARCGFYRELFDNGFAPATSANQISNV